jgi:hypothetical protein
VSAKTSERFPEQPIRFFLDYMQTNQATGKSQGTRQYVVAHHCQRIQKGQNGKLFSSCCGIDNRPGGSPQRLTENANRPRHGSLILRTVYIGHLLASAKRFAIKPRHTGHNPSRRIFREQVVTDACRAIPRYAPEPRRSDNTTCAK